MAPRIYRGKVNHTGDPSLDEYMRTVSTYPLISREEECRLAKQIHEGNEEAYHKLVKANLLFVVKQAKKYYSPPAELSDLINEGNVGLMTAARKFDETRGFKFTTYAVWWIRQGILEYLHTHARSVRLPTSHLREMQIVKRRIGELERSQMREGLIHQQIEREFNLERPEVDSIMSGYSVVSLNAPLNDESDTTHIDNIVSEGEDTQTDARLYKNALKSDLELAFTALNAREARILKLYFGLNEDETELTLEEIGAVIRVSRERVRQIKDRALEKLRAVSTLDAHRTLVNSDR